MATMPQLNMKVHLDFGDARRQVRRVLALAGEANRELAKLEDRVEALRDQLSAYGITLEVD